MVLHMEVIPWQDGGPRTFCCTRESGPVQHLPSASYERVRASRAHCSLVQVKAHWRSRANTSLMLLVPAGIVGLPNVGKSSLINSLKRARVAAVGNTPGVTRAAQEVHLDKHVKLLDSPGIVFSAGSSPAAALRNCVKVRAALKRWQLRVRV